MGNSNKNKQKIQQSQNKQQENDQYLDCFKQCQINPLYLQSLFVQNKKLLINLMKLFPECLVSYQNFSQMVQYLRKYQLNLTTNQQAYLNMSKTTILDRFFMLCLGINDFKQYQKQNLSINQTDQILCDYMSLFMQNPSKGNIEKILHFVNLPDRQKINIKEFSQKFRQYFPHVQKYLKDYYQSKFRDREENGLLLKNINSKIIQGDAIFLALKIPRIASNDLTMLYSSDIHGLGFSAIQNKLIGYTGPWLLLVQHKEKDQNGKNINYVFGSYQNGPIKDVNTYQGDITGFMFIIHPKIRFMTTDKGESGNNYFYINNLPEEVTKKRKGIGFGGNQNKTNFKLWIDQDVDRSTVWNGNDPTYGYGTLAGPGTEKLNIYRLQVWALGNSQNLEDQANYWKQRQIQITKRRKVNKKDLIDGNAHLMFEKTFAHREQVIGEIERKQKDQKK